MIIRQINESSWEHVCSQIITHGRGAPMCLQYDIEISSNGVKYILKVQPGRKRKLAALQAIGVYPDKNKTGGMDYRLIEDNLMISALLEIIIHQGAK